MIVEVIAVGTELLLGQIVNSNVAHIGRKLADEGFAAHFQVTVGDNLERLAETITTAIERADAVILSGGIGPTQDDLTREALCLATGRAMQRNNEYAAVISRRLEAIRGTVPQTNLRMADHPEGATQLPNANGVALGLAMEQDGVALFAVPGVPSEMMTMVDEQVMPRLRLAAGAPAAMRSRVIRTWGLGESGVAERLDALFSEANPSVAFLVDGPEVSVRITARADSPEAAEAMIDPVESRVREALGEVVFGRDDETVEALLLSALDERGWTLGTAEVATAGLLASRLAGLDGSASFKGSMVFPEFGVESSGDAVGKAESVAARLEADVGVWVGPASAADDGSWATVTVGVHTPDEGRARRLRLLGNRTRVAQFAAVSAIHVARLAVVGKWWKDEFAAEMVKSVETMEESHE